MLLPVWIRIIFFLITNGPAIIKFISQIIDLFDGDAKAVKSTLQEMQISGALKRIKETDDWENVKGIIERHREYAAKRKRIFGRGSISK